ncbi:hypothetical protein Ac2012v2_000795 [Leucoagaricus gongylophorus]
MAGILTVIVEGDLRLVLVLTEVIVFRREVVVTAGEVAMVVEEAVEEVELETIAPMMGECTVDIATIWKLTMSMILRLLTKIPITRMSVHTQAIIRVLESMKTILRTDMMTMLVDIHVVQGALPCVKIEMTKYTIQLLKNASNVSDPAERSLSATSRRYETNSDDVRRQFEEFGSIKTFFDLISTRGMVFVTYYDLRAAERARDRLQGSEISGRPIDVHYSLPRDDQKGPERERNQQFQGTLQVTLRASPSGQPIDDTEVRRKFQAFGDIKSVRPANDRVDSRYVEFYDIRNCEDAFNALRHQGLQDGVMDIVYAWDYTEGQLEGRANGGRRDWEGIDIHRGRGSGGSRGRGRGRGRGGHSGGHQINEWEDRREYGRDRDPRRGRYENEHSGRGGRGGGYGDKFDNRNGGYGGGSGGGNSAGYNSTPPSFAPSSTGQPSTISGDDRLEQARKVQQLLAALKQPQPGAASVAPPSHVVTPPISPSVQASASMPPFAPYPPTSTLQQPSYASSLPPSNSYAGASPNASMNVAGLPPNVLALLQGAQQRQPTPPQYGGPSLPLPGPPGVPHQSVSQFQQLMSYLQTQGKQ